MKGVKISLTWSEVCAVNDIYAAVIAYWSSSRDPRTRLCVLHCYEINSRAWLASRLGFPGEKKFRLSLMECIASRELLSGVYIGDAAPVPEMVRIKILTAVDKIL